MAQRTISRSCLSARITAIAVALSLLAASTAASAGPAAIDEYSLGQVGDEIVVATNAGGKARLDGAPVVETLGIVGEDAGSQSTFDAITSTAGAAGLAVLAGALLLFGCIAIVRSRVEAKPR